MKPEDFRTVHLLVYSPEPVESSFIRDELRPAGVTPQKISGIPSTEGLLELAKSGLGIAVVARWAAALYLHEGSLRAVRVGRAGVYRDWHAVRLRRHAHAAVLDDFAQLTREFGPGLTE